MSNSKFILPENSVFHDGQGGVFTNKNLTDADAIKALAHNPKAIRQFISSPDNWEDLVEEYEQEIKDFQKKNNTKKKPLPAPKVKSKVEDEETEDETDLEDDDETENESDEETETENEQPTRSPISPKKPAAKRSAPKKPGK